AVTPMLWTERHEIPRLGGEEHAVYDADFVWLPRGEPEPSADGAHEPLLGCPVDRSEFGLCLERRREIDEIRLARIMPKAPKLDVARVAVFFEQLGHAHRVLRHGVVDDRVAREAALMAQRVRDVLNLDRMAIGGQGLETVAREGLDERHHDITTPFGAWWP